MGGGGGCDQSWIFKDFTALITFLGDLITALVQLLARPREVRWEDVFFYMRRAGADGLPIVGLIRPAAGRVLVRGTDIAAAEDEELNRIRRGIGVLFQSDVLLGSLTLGENVALPLGAFAELSPETVNLIVRMKLGMVNLGG